VGGLDESRSLQSADGFRSQFYDTFGGAFKYAGIEHHSQPVAPVALNPKPQTLNPNTKP